MPNENPPDDAWNPEFAEALLGNILLVGLTRLDADGELVEQRQLFGRVVSVDPQSGIRLLLEGSRAGESFYLPPDTRSIAPASPGQYTLRSTGEVVEDPDFLVNYTITRPARTQDKPLSR